MIFVDASAMVALALNEQTAVKIASIIDAGEALCTSPIAIYEAALAIARVREVSSKISHSEVMVMIHRAEIEIITISDSAAEYALAAHQRFGKGNHLAKLNMGDCFAYAVAKSRDAKILFVGNDFSQTDLESAVPAL